MTNKRRRHRPLIIQGGMGVKVANWKLAAAVTRNGGFATVSGVALARTMALQLQRGDEGGHLRRALDHFPFPHIAKKVLDAFYIDASDRRNKARRGIPVYSLHPSDLLIASSICANFAEVWLANDAGIKGRVGINYLEKIQMSIIFEILGAMLADVEYIAMGAGIPWQIPEVINSILEGRLVKYHVSIDGNGKTIEVCFDPKGFFGGPLPAMNRPRFFPIVGSHVLAQYMVKKNPSQESIDGFIVEEHIAGGHNAPPRGTYPSTADGQPIYGKRDDIDYDKISDLGQPFWIGGGMASPEMIERALSLGATGVQVGSAFAFCNESGMDPHWKSAVIRLAYNNNLEVFTDAICSPTGFPFKVARVPGTLSDKEVYMAQKRACRHGALVTLYERTDGSIGYRCPGEPVEQYVKQKGGNKADTEGRICLCEALINASGLDRGPKVPIITVGDDITRLIPILVSHENGTYSAADVFRYLRGQ